MSLIITTKGIAASMSAGDLGIKIKITHVSLGTAGYVPNANQSTLREEVAKVAITNGIEIGTGNLHFEAEFSGPDSYVVKEVGYWLENGVLFAIDSRDGDIISTKTADTVITEVFQLRMSGETISNITVMLTGSQRRYPIGHMLFTENPANPATYGYPGFWEKQPGDMVICSVTELAEVGKVLGDNYPTVPVPAHGHVGQLVGDQLPGHAHLDGASSRAYPNAHQFGQRTGNARSEGTSGPGSYNTHPLTESVSAGTPTGAVHVDATGVANATLDVRGKRRTAFIWIRVAALAA